MCAVSNCYKSGLTLKLGLVLFSATLMTTGCGGGSDGSGAPGGSGGGHVSHVDDPFPAVNFNGHLQGRIYVSGSSKYLDLSSGEVVDIPGDYALPNKGGEEVVEYYDSYRSLNDGLCGRDFGFLDRIVLRDATSGIANASFELDDDAAEPMALSPDGQTLAAPWQGCSGEGFRITVFSRQGNVIARAAQKINSFDWTPDNRLAVTYGQKVALETERNTFRLQTLADMSSVEGTPSRISVSPDGSRILFEMVTSASNFLHGGVFFRDATVWSVNADGSDLQQLATTSRYLDPTISAAPQVTAPTWSPDGSSLLLTENYSGGGLVITNEDFVVVDYLAVANEGLSYALPVTATPVALPPERYSESGVRPLVGKNLDGTRQLQAFKPAGPMMWTPITTKAPTYTGSLPADNGRLNRGLTGEVLYMVNEGEYPAMKSLDLNSGLVTDYKAFREEHYWLYTSPLTGLSADGKYTAHHVYKGVNNPVLRIYDANVERVASLRFDTDRYYYKPESALRFSPVNSDYIAWIYDDGNFGTGAIVLNWRTKRFLGNWSGTNFTELAWTREGDLMLFELGKAYRTTVSNGQFTDLKVVFDIPDTIEHPAVNLVTNEIAFSSGGQIFSITPDGKQLRRIVQFSAPSVDYPAWSPDGKYLSVLRGEFDSYIVAADAENVKLYDSGRSVGAVEVERAGDDYIPIIRGPLLWRR